MTLKQSCSRLTLELPFPPSTNNLWRSSRGRVHKSQQYTQWIAEADALYLTQKRSLARIGGKFVALLQLHTSDGRKRKDADNRFKAPLDFCTRVGLIDDDKYMEIGTVMWVVDNLAPPYGARLTLWRHLG